MPPPVCIKFYLQPPLSLVVIFSYAPLEFSNPPPPPQVIITQFLRRKPSLGATDLRTGESVFVGKKRLNTMCSLENNSKDKEAVEFIDASLHLFCEDSAL